MEGAYRPIYTWFEQISQRLKVFTLPYTVAVFSPPTSFAPPSPSPLLFPVGLAAVAMKSFSFSLLTAALFVVGVSAQEDQLTIVTPSVLLVLLLAQFYAYIQSLVQDERGSMRTSYYRLVRWHSSVHSFFCMFSTIN